MDNSFQYTYTITAEDCDSTGKVLPSNLNSILPKAASLHSNAVGLDFSWLSERNLTWVLLNYKIQYYHLPSVGDSLTCFTWSKKHKRIQALRSFAVYNDKGDLVLKAGSDWVLINTLRRRPTKPTDEMYAKYGSSDQYIFEDDSFTQPEFQTSHWNLSKDIVVSKDCIDQNGHVNNQIYINWHLDTIHSATNLPVSLSEFSIQEMLVHFKKEAFEKDILNHSCSLYIDGSSFNFVSKFTSVDEICQITSSWR